MVGAGTLCWRASRATAPWIVSISVGRLRMMSSRIEDLELPVPPPEVSTSFINTERASATSSATPSAFATAAASSTARNTISCSSGMRMISTERRSVTAEIAPSATLPSSFFHFSRLMSALAVTGRPCAVKALAIATVRSLKPPFISPMYVGRSPKLRTTPGPSARPACAVSPPTTLLSPRTPASVCSLPIPFWNVIATVSPSNRCFTLFAAASFANALHWNSTTSALLISVASVVAFTLMSRSPPTPTMRMPFSLMRATCSGHASTRVMSSPPSASRPPNKPPIAPAPTTTTFGLSNDMRVSRSIRGAAAGDVEHEARGEAARRTGDPGAKLRHFVDLHEAPHRDLRLHVADVLLGHAPEQRRLGHRGRDAVHRYAGIAELFCQGLGEADHASLRGRIGGDVRHAFLAGDRRHRDDASVLVVAHMPGGDPAGIEHRRHVDGDDTIPVLERVFPGRLDRPVDARAVDQDVDLAELVRAVIECLFDRLVVRHIDGLRERGREAALFQRRDIAIPHDHLRAALRDQLCDAKPDAAGRAGHDGDLAVEFRLHVFLTHLRMCVPTVQSTPSWFLIVMSAVERRRSTSIALMRYSTVMVSPK